MGDEVGDGLAAGLRSTQLVEALLLGRDEGHNAIGGRRFVGCRHRDLGSLDHGGIAGVQGTATGQHDNGDSACEQMQNAALCRNQIHKWAFLWFKPVARITGLVAWRINDRVDHHSAPGEQVTITDQFSPDGLGFRSWHECNFGGRLVRAFRIHTRKSQLA